MKAQFVKKEGDGKNVLQREANVVTAIERARATSRSGQIEGPSIGP